MRFDIAPTGVPNEVHASPVDAGPTYTDHDFGVAVLRWPRDEHRRAALQSQRNPRLLLIAEGRPAPVPSDELEDWTRSAPGSRECDARIAELARRSRSAPPNVRLSGRRLQRGSREVTLSAAQSLTIAALLQHCGRPVPRAVVTDALSIADVASTAAAVRALLTQLDRLVAPLGVRVWLLSSQAVLLEVL
ncbi:MAG: hypothetical protein ABI658_10710 [Acidimicrobiales bacterium]